MKGAIMADCSHSAAHQMQKKANQSNKLFAKCEKTGNKDFCKQGRALANEVRAWLKKCGDNIPRRRRKLRAALNPH